MMRKEQWPVAIGVVLLVAYVVQARVDALAWTWLVERQAGDTYKILTGCVLAGHLVWQWSVRSRRHKLVGAFAPLVLYVHASRFAYGYLFVLALGYLGATAIGLLHRAALRSRRVFAWWFVIHIATVTMLLLLVIYHVVIALAYE